MKKILLVLFLVFMMFLGSYVFWVPSYKDNFKPWVVWGDSDQYNNTEIWTDHGWLELKDKIYNIFDPSGWSWVMWDYVRIIWVWLLVVFIVRWWFKILYNADNESERKKAQMNLLYLFYWAILLYWASFIVWSALNLESTTWLSETASDVQTNIFLLVLTFLKWWAYFVWLLMICYHAFNMMRANENEDQIKNSRKWIINVILALIFIKVIDYIFYIAQQENFKWLAWDLIIRFNSSIWYILWWMAVLVIMYAWILLATSMWDEEKWKDSKTIITKVFLIFVIVSLFLLIVNQILREFYI